MHRAGKMSSPFKGLTQSMGKTVFFCVKKKRFFKMIVLRAQTELEVHILTPYNPSTLFWTVLLILADLTCVSRNLVSKCSWRQISGHFLVIYNGNKGFIIQNQVIMVLFSFIVQLLSFWEWFLMFRSAFQCPKSAFHDKITTGIYR